MEGYGIACEKTPLIAPSDVRLLPVVRNHIPVDPELQAPEWVGLSHLELKEYLAEPFWVRLRLVIFCTFWLLFVALLGAAVAITVRAPPCCGGEWWTEGPIYSVLAQSYRDYDSSGLGDIAGIQSKLEYLAEIGVKTVWLSPIYKSPMKDFGYDIQDFKDVDEKFGTLTDFKQLVSSMKEKGLKLVMDFVPNHSSDQHDWFLRSVAREEPYTDYYVWAAPKVGPSGEMLPPNNWLSLFGGSAWQWHAQRGEFYLHQFAKEQPDLNYRNPEVLQEMVDVLQFWLDLGVDGFRVDAIPHLFEDSELRDEPLSNQSYPGMWDCDSLDHIYTQNLPEVMDVLQKIRTVLDSHSANTDGIRRLLIAEVYSNINTTISYYGTDTKPLADFPFNVLLATNLDSNSTAEDMKANVEMWMENMPVNRTANWVLGNHDRPRVASRLGSEMVDGLHMISMLLPGTAVTYYGEEIGMEDTNIGWEHTQDPAGLGAGPGNYQTRSRDPTRTPMQWSDQKNAGFSEADSTWLPVNPNYPTLNVEQQRTVHSHLTVYKALVKARSNAAIAHGSLQLEVVDSCVFAFTRIDPDSVSYLIAVNWSTKTVTADLTIFSSVPKEATVYVASVNYSSNYNEVIQTNSVVLGPKEGVVLNFMPAKIS